MLRVPSQYVSSTFGEDFFTLLTCVELWNGKKNITFGEKRSYWQKNQKCLLQDVTANNCLIVDRTLVLFIVVAQKADLWKTLTMLLMSILMNLKKYDHFALKVTAALVAKNINSKKKLHGGGPNSVQLPLSSIKLGTLARTSRVPKPYQIQVPTIGAEYLRHWIRPGVFSFWLRAVLGLSLTMRTAYIGWKEGASGCLISL